VIFYGIYAGGYNALLPTTITEIYGVENYANVNGFIYFIRGIGTLFGAPLAGALLGSHKRAGETSDRIGDLISLQKRFNDVAVYAGILLLAAGCCASYVRWLDSREKGRWRWVA
jgi:MFS family permease